MDTDSTFSKLRFLVTMFIMTKIIVFLCSCCDFLFLAEFIRVCAHTLILYETNSFLYFSYDSLWIAYFLNKGVMDNEDFTFSKFLRILVTMVIQTETIIRLYPCCDYLFLAKIFRSSGYAMILFETIIYLSYSYDLRQMGNFFIAFIWFIQGVFF